MCGWSHAAARGPTLRGPTLRRALGVRAETSGGLPFPGRGLVVNDRGRHRKSWRETESGAEGVGRAGSDLSALPQCLTWSSGLSLSPPPKQSNTPKGFPERGGQNLGEQTTVQGCWGRGSLSHFWPASSPMLPSSPMPPYPSVHTETQWVV